MKKIKNHLARMSYKVVILGMFSSWVVYAAPAENKDILHLKWRDTQIQPSENFYAYANGNWQKQNPIPPQYSNWGMFSILNEKVQLIVHKMLIEAANNKAAPSGSVEQKVGDFYFSGMDETSINKLGISPLKPEFDRIDAIKNVLDLQNVIANLHLMGVDVAFSFGNMQDFKNSKEMIGAAVQAGLGLPDRDYYLKVDPKFQEIRAKYVNYISKVFQLLGDAPDVAANEAKIVMGMETALAQASMTQIEERDPYAIYHMMDRTALEKATPNFSWPRYFAAIGHTEIQYINLAMPAFFKKFNEMLSSISINDWKIYLRWHLAESFSPYLSQPFVDEQFKMSSALSGTKKLLPRWKRVVSTENDILGFAIGKLYVERYVSPQTKEEVLQILHEIRSELHEDLQTLSWMTPKTRAAALKKLDLMEERVGYPSKWRDYSALKIDRGPYVLNVKRGSEFLVKRQLNKIGKPVDRTEWAMTPQTINAYYDPSMNNINIPAGIMQSPFFNSAEPAALNYGTIGFVIGHEITHGFDDEGSQFDGYGNLNKWWTPVDLKKFQDATNCIVTQFSQYKVDGDFPVQGKLVAGEATADLGGLNLAYRAFHKSAAYKKAKIIDGMTPDQQFFLGVAHVWATNMRPEALRHLVTIDPHPPAQYRVNGTLANMPEFQAAFAIPKKSPMLNLHPCIIW